MKTIIIISLLLIAEHAFAQENSTNVKPVQEAESTNETTQQNSSETQQNAVPIVSHKSTEPVEIELKVAEPAVRKEETPEK